MEKVIETADRYAVIDEQNTSSWYLNDPERPFRVAMSLHDIGPSRERKLARYAVVPNVSPAYGPLSVDKSKWPELARQNLNTFLNSIDINPATVRILHPDRDYTTPLKIVDVDKERVNPSETDAIYLTHEGDFIYTFDPSISLAVRPADCPVVAAYGETPHGSVRTMTHFAWEGVAAGYIDQMFAAYDKLEIDRNSLKLYVTPGAHAENFGYTNYPQDPRQQFPGLNNPDDLFVKVTKQPEIKDKSLYSFTVDTPAYVYKELLANGLSPEQIFVDTTDTAALDAGTSSNTRMVNSHKINSLVLPEDNARDVIVVSPEHV